MADELRPVVDPQPGRGAVAGHEFGEQAHDAGGGQGKIDLDAAQFAVPVLDHVQGAEAPPVGQGVAPEVERPAQVGRGGLLERALDTFGQPPSSKRVGKPVNCMCFMQQNKNFYCMKYMQ